ESSPSTRADPAEGLWNPSRVRISVDFPAPLGPRRPIALPRPAVPRRHVIPLRISRLPSTTLRFSSSTTAASFGVMLWGRSPTCLLWAGRRPAPLSVYQLLFPHHRLPGRLIPRWYAVRGQHVDNEARQTSTTRCANLFHGGVQNNQHRLAIRQK